MLVAIIAVIASTCSRNSTPAAENASQPTTAASVNESANDDASQTFFETIQGNASSIAAASSNIPDGSVQAFSLAGNAAPTLSQSHQDAIEQALDAYGSTATFVVLNLASGQGICHNAHDSLFGASSFKAMYCAYLCSQLIESGTLALSSPVPNATTDYDPASPDDWEDPLCLGGLMQNTLILSDNTAYETLRVYDYLGYDEWMNALRLSSLLYSPRTWYPDYSAAQGFIMWANIYSYMQSNSATATWLQQQMQKTQLSFLRNGLSERAQVLCSKAGWDDDVENGFTAMSDGGILQTENATFLVSILTAKPGVEETFPAMNALVNSIIGTALDVLSQE